MLSKQLHSDQTKQYLSAIIRIILICSLIT